jgi:hypothetical protein
MAFQFMASISKLFREALINASNVSRLSHVLLPLLIQFCFENSCSQMTIFIGITANVCDPRLYNTNYNECKQLLPPTLQYNFWEKPTWPRIWMLISSVEKGLLARLW